MKHAIVFFVFIVTLTPAALAVEAGMDLYLPSVGHGEGQCPGGVCSQWRSDTWIYNPSESATATVEVEFLQRDSANHSPPSQTVSVAPGETRELLDVVLSLFGLDNAYGALRFVSDLEVVVTGRVYDANVQTNLGTGTAGQFFAALPAAMAIGLDQGTDLFGLAQDVDGTWRSNFGLVETSATAVTVEVSARDASGALLATRSYELEPREVIQRSILDVGGGIGSNHRLEVRVTSGSGRVLAFASRLDNRTGDPSTVEMWVAATSHATGAFEGAVWDPAGTLLDGVVRLSVSQDGLVAYEGLAGIPCGSGTFVVDFFDIPTAPVAISDGLFNATATIAYSDGSTTVFTTEWTLDGAVGDHGVVTGTLRSDTTGGTGAWADCNADGVVRAWRAGWSGSQ